MNPAIKKLEESILVLHCSEPPNNPNKILGPHPKYNHLRIKAVPQLGSGFPVGLEKIIFDETATKIIFIGHANLPTCDGCKGLELLGKIKDGHNLKNRGLQSWIEGNLISPDPFSNAVEMAKHLATKVSGWVELAAFILDQTGKLHLIGSRPPGTGFTFVSLNNWEDYLNQLDNLRLDARKTSTEIQQIITLNSFAPRVSSKNCNRRPSHIILNSTFYPPDALTVVAKILKNNPIMPGIPHYFSTYYTCLSPSSSINQLMYALSKFRPKTDGVKPEILLLAHTPELIEEMTAHLLNSKQFSYFTDEVGLKEAITPVIVERPY